MEKQCASDLAEILLRHSRELDAFLDVLQRRGNDDDFQAARKIVGRVMAEMYSAAFYPLYQTYPELKPPEFP